MYGYYNILDIYQYFLLQYGSKILKESIDFINRNINVLYYKKHFMIKSGEKNGKINRLTLFTTFFNHYHI
ncbi:hypothetical protein HERIO_534 [Hepatospora eriocheir]|uniref:Uncharacterized protein n=1 Tax=Hepatospora eriocheir TaxID=1081669 RepID=A0A1X0QD72_9MICR|nr:hypothetical protein HERIO_534 [Hepatospora eriocheir]